MATALEKLPPCAEALLALLLAYSWQVSAAVQWHHPRPWAAVQGNASARGNACASPARQSIPLNVTVHVLATNGGPQSVEPMLRLSQPIVNCLSQQSPAQ